MAAAKPAPRVHEHLEALRAAGLDTQAFFEALVAIRDDTALPAAHREALYKCVAMESYVWYLEALLGEPIDRVKAMAEARAVAEENAAAIKREKPGDASAQLLERDIRRGPARPDPSKAPSARGPAPRSKVRKPSPKE